MGPVVYINIVIVGITVFAALHYIILWWWSRRARALLLFAMLSALIGAATATIVRLMTTTSVATAQFMLNMRSTLGLLVYALLLWIIYEMVGAGSRRLVRTVVVLLLLVAAMNVVIPIN